MNEAARLYVENVASPEGIDKATTWGLGLRFAVLGIREFIDFGGATTWRLAASAYTPAPVSWTMKGCI